MVSLMISENTVLEARQNDRRPVAGNGVFQGALNCVITGRPMRLGVMRAAAAANAKATSTTAS
jgi:hypothetical protein